MFPPDFDYERVASVPEALERLATHAEVGRDVALLAGGHGLVPALKAGDRAPDVVVDLDVDELAGVTVHEDHLAVGALTTYADVAGDGAVRTHAPVLADAAAAVGDRQIRNRGTLGGNLAAAHPAADPPAAVLAAGATLVLRRRDGEREVPAAAFFRGDRATALEPGEVLTEIRVPRRPDAGSAYVRRTHPTTGYATVGVAAVLEIADGVVTDARLAATGVVDRPTRLRAVEDAVEGAATDGAGNGAMTDESDAGRAETDDPVTDAASAAPSGVDGSRVRSDATVSGEFRTALLETYARRALTAAVE